MAQALLFNLTGEKRKKIDFLLMQHGIRGHEVQPEAFGRSLGDLLGVPGHPAAPEMGEAFSDEMLVLDGLSPQQFHGLLNGMQMLQAPVSYKAMTTGHNLSWTPIRLHRELVAEHAALAEARRKDLQ